MTRALSPLSTMSSKAMPAAAATIPGSMAQPFEAQCTSTQTASVQHDEHGDAEHGSVVTRPAALACRPMYRMSCVRASCILDQRARCVSVLHNLGSGQA